MQPEPQKRGSRCVESEMFGLDLLDVAAGGVLGAFIVLSGNGFAAWIRGFFKPKS
jgi:hypothetical protein